MQVFQQTAPCCLSSSKSVCGSEQQGETNLVCHSTNTKARQVQEGMAFVGENVPLLFARVRPNTTSAPQSYSEGVRSGEQTQHSSAVFVFRVL